MNFENYAQQRVEQINGYLEQTFSRYRQGCSQRFLPLIEAMQYALEGGGKRFRPLLLLASSEYLGIAPHRVLPAACAIEFIHSYSLVHDDLPALDDDEMRRGRPSSHVQFGEAVAILAGDALLTEAFTQLHRLMDHGDFTAAQVLSSVEFLAHQSGVRGLVGGQLIDVTILPEKVTIPEIEFIHIHKTGAMILASVLMPTKLIPVEDTKLRALRRYGEAVGLAFQISDDILDAESAVRYSRGPRKKPKPSYQMAMSPVEMKEHLNSLIDSAVNAIKPDGEKALPLIAIAEFIRTRKS